MAQYKVRSGQNIYDVALTLHGSVEGIFDLLVSNSWLNMETRLSYGMVLNYHEELSINQNIAIWLGENNILVKNGEYFHRPLDIADLIKEHIETHHSDILQSISELSTDERNMYWESLYTPRIIIHQQGQLSEFLIRLKDNTHLIVDWGDYSTPQLFEGKEEHDIEHCYKGHGKHIITLYGDFSCTKLDFRKLNGIYFPLGMIYAEEFLTDLDNEEIKKLIVTQ